MPIHINIYNKTNSDELIKYLHLAGTAISDICKAVRASRKWRADFPKKSQPSIDQLNDKLDEDPNNEVIQNSEINTKYLEFIANQCEVIKLKAQAGNITNAELGLLLPVLKCDAIYNMNTDIPEPEPYVFSDEI